MTIPVDFDFVPGAGLAVTLTATVGDATAPAPDLVTWHFGDGTTATGNPATHTYSAAGSYYVDVHVAFTVSGEAKAANMTRAIPVGQSYVDAEGVPLEGDTDPWEAETPGGRIATPAPVLTSITPATAVHGAANLTTTATGTGFQPKSILRLAGVAMPTTYISATTLTAVVPVLTAVAGTPAVTVRNPDGRVSAGQTFTFT